MNKISLANILQGFDSSDMLYGCIGIIVSWLITRYYSRTTEKNITQAIEGKEMGLASPIIDLLKRVNSEIDSDSIIAMTSKANEDRDENLYKKALLLGSLYKMDKNDTCYIGYRELTNYSSEVFRKHIDYVLAKLVSLNNQLGGAFLLAVTLDKLRYEETR